eukprot:TRINITY_DN6022_c0_g1_i1.p1 TRINITY_DN6022_c0_g1~~TRINITY_DN6022_c0_g1_i1.p1  ORF type:complete len:712 (+),score=114.76 TRINITY_DN6022_c0_g1_i1:115-2250(+)
MLLSSLSPTLSQYYFCFMLKLYKNDLLLTRTGLIGLDYLRTVLQDLVVHLLSDDELTFEIDPQRLPTEYGTDVDQVLEDNMQMLKDTAQIFIDRITDPASVDLFPRELRAIAAYIYNCAQQSFPHQAIPLVGSFAFLRVISPALVTPESFGVLPPDMSAPPPAKRRNLVLLAKLLQNCANGVLFGTKEDYMKCMNDFVTTNGSKMTDFLHRLVLDGGGEDSTQWTQYDREESGDSEEFPFNTGDFELSDLMRLHHLVKDNEGPFVSEVGEMVATREVSEDLFRRLKALLECLGPAPFLTRTSNDRNVTQYQEAPESSMMDDASVDCAVEVETDALAKAGFFFVGPPTKDKQPVVWVIVSKFRFEYLESMNTLISYIYKVMKSLQDQPYVVVVDMTWARITTEMKSRIYSELTKMQSIFEHRVRKNLVKVYIVHPSAYSKAVLLFMRSFTSGKLKKKIQDVYNWKDLTESIPLNDIMLPETSRDYVTTAYKVVKINAKGKRQRRLIKMTHDSILNIDPKNKRVQNEKRLGTVEELTASPGSLEISIRFEGKDKTSTFKEHGRSEDSTFRRYLCSSLADRDNIIRDVFRSSIMSSLHPDAKHEYHVVKVNQRGRHQDRIFVITCDSLLNLDKRIIKSEHSFAGIEEIVESKDAPGTFLLKFKMKSKERKIICDPADAESLLHTLREAMRRYGQEDEWATREEMFSDLADKEGI